MADPVLSPATTPNPFSSPAPLAVDVVVPPGQPVTDDSSRLFRRLRGSFSPSTQRMLSTTPALQPIPTPSKTMEELALLERILDEVEQTPAQTPTPTAVATVALQATNTLNPLGPSSTAKERFESAVSPDAAAVDAAAGMQVVESEKSAEIPVEVEQFLQEVTSHQTQLPHEIVLADLTAPASAATHTATTPVVILPITPEVEDFGMKKSTHWSVRWLVEWSRKIMKIFSGQVIYRPQEGVKPS